jgi:hypothetical protein
VFPHLTLNFQAVFPYAMDIAIGKGTESLEFRHWHLEPDIGASVGGCKNSPTEIYYLSILLHPK